MNEILVYICNLPQDVGKCSERETRFWYNAVEGKCEQFTYSGCGANSNNFEEMQKCETICGGITAVPRCIRGDAMRDPDGNYFQCSPEQPESCPPNYGCYFDGNTWGCCPLPRKHPKSLWNQSILTFHLNSNFEFNISFEFKFWLSMRISRFFNFSLYLPTTNASGIFVRSKAISMVFRSGDQTMPKLRVFGLWRKFKQFSNNAWMQCLLWCYEWYFITYLYIFYLNLESRSLESTIFYHNLKFQN